MKNVMKIALVAVSMVLAVVAPAQIEMPKDEVRKDSVVTLLQTIDEPASVVLFRNDNYVVSASFTQFRSNLTDWIQQYPGIPEDKKLLELVEKAAVNSEVIDAVIIAAKHNLVERLNYRLASLLQSGKCMIYDKKKYGPVSSITVQTYSYYCGPLCGSGGRRFLIGTTLFFEVIDWIS